MADNRLFDEACEAIARAAESIPARESDGSFLERSLRDAVARELSPPALVERPLDLASWDVNLGKVDVLWSPRAAAGPVGIETKVWDVADSLYDLLKLASATAEGILGLGIVVVGGRSRDWARANPLARLSAAGPPMVLSDVAALLEESGDGWEKLLSRAAAHPHRLPTHVETIACEPIKMPRVPDHSLRVIAVRASANVRGELWIRLDEARQEAPADEIFYSRLPPRFKVSELDRLHDVQPDDEQLARYLSSARRQREAELLSHLEPDMGARHDTATSALLREVGALKVAAAIEDRLELYEEEVADFIAEESSECGPVLHSTEEVFDWSLQALRPVTGALQAACLAEALLIPDDEDGMRNQAGVAWIMMELTMTGEELVESTVEEERSAVASFRIDHPEPPWGALDESRGGPE